MYCYVFISLSLSPSLPSLQAQSSSADLISPAERLQKDLSSLLDTSLYSDVLIKVSNERSISGHAAVLAARCPAMARVC